MCNEADVTSVNSVTAMTFGFSKAEKLIQKLTHKQQRSAGRFGVKVSRCYETHLETHSREEQEEREERARKLL